MKLVLNSQEMVNAILDGLIAQRRIPQPGFLKPTAVFVRHRKKSEPEPSVESIVANGSSDSEYTVVVSDDPDIIKKIKEQSS